MRAYPGRWGRLGRRGERGQAIIETALLLPFIFLLILLVIEFGFFLWMNLNINAAAREAARYAAVGGPVGGASCASEPDTVKGRAFDVALERIECAEVVVSYAERVPPAASIGAGDGITVQINHAYAPITGGFPALGLGPTIYMCARADARVEYAPPTPVASPAPTAAICPPPTATPKAGG